MLILALVVLLAAVAAVAALWWFDQFTLPQNGSGSLLYHYQALVGAGVALVAAVLTVLMIGRQIDAARQEFRSEARRILLQETGTFLQEISRLRAEIPVMIDVVSGGELYEGFIRQLRSEPSGLIVATNNNVQNLIGPERIRRMESFFSPEIERQIAMLRKRSHEIERRASLQLSPNPRKGGGVQTRTWEEEASIAVEREFWGLRSLADDLEELEKLLINLRERAQRIDGRGIFE